MRRLTSGAGLGALLILMACGAEPSHQASSPATGAADSTVSGEEITGRWRPFRAPPSAPENDLTAEQRDAIERLESIGYAAGSKPARTNEIVPTHVTGRCYDGLNFFTSGHAPVALLVDMDGRVVHQWAKSFDEVWPEGGSFKREAGSDHWRQAQLLPDGSILAIFEGSGLVKLDRDSNVIWAKGNGAHHDLKVTESGDIYVLARKAHLVPRVHPTEPILEDYVLVLDADGNEKRRISILEAFEGTEFASLGFRHAKDGGDLFHTNAIEILEPGPTYQVEWLRPGYLLISMRTPSLLAVIDPSSGKVIHAWQGPYRRQHDPSLLANGDILLFDNTSLKTQSRILELDPTSDSVRWEYRGQPGQPLASWTCGTVQRLPNGNTLITESDNGHAIEIDSNSRPVWEYYNPYRVQADDQTYIATLFEMHRIGPEFPTAWLNE